jgi:hypothetical protein
MLQGSGGRTHSGAQVQANKTTDNQIASMEAPATIIFKAHDDGSSPFMPIGALQDGDGWGDDSRDAE